MACNSRRWIMAETTKSTVIAALGTSLRNSEDREKTLVSDLLTVPNRHVYEFRQKVQPSLHIIFVPTLPVLNLIISILALIDCSVILFRPDLVMREEN